MTNKRASCTYFSFILFFNEFALRFQCIPYGKTGFRRKLFNLAEHLFHLRPVRIVFIGTVLDLFFITSYGCPLLDIFFLLQTKWSDDRDGHLTHFQADGHRHEMSLEKNVEHSSMDDVILMVAQGYLVAVELLSFEKELLASIPRT